MALSNFAVWKYIFDIRHGRIHRADYFISGLSIKVFLDVLDYYFPDPDRIEVTFLLAVYVVIFYLSALITARRFRDINLTGWWALPLLLMPIFWIVYMHVFNIRDAGTSLLMWSLFGLFATVMVPNIYLLLVPPKKKQNKFGEYLPSVFAVNSVKSMKDIWREIKDRAERFAIKKS